MPQAEATHGKVRFVPVTEIKPGMRIERDVHGFRGKILMNAGEVVTQKHIIKAKKWEAQVEPRGPALAKENPKDKRERVRFGKWEGGYKLSHFNPRGILVSTTLASGDEVPDVEKDPTRSPLFQNAPTKSFNVGSPEESPLIRIMNIKAEIGALEKTNQKLKGVVHAQEAKLITEQDYLGRRDALSDENNRLIETLVAGKESDLSPRRGRPKIVR